MRNLMINLGLLVTTIILFFGGTELALRLSGVIHVYPSPPGIYQHAQNPAISYQLIPSMQKKAFRSTITTNNMGFRGSELDLTKPIIAMLGDSITFGYGLEDTETIPARLQELLSDFSVINAAAPGYNLTQQTAVYQEKIAHLNPQILILILHSNDLENGGGKISVLDEEGFLREPDAQKDTFTCTPITQGILGLLPGKCWLDRHSAFYVAMKKFVNMKTGQKYLKEKEAKGTRQDIAETITKIDLQVYAEQLDRLVALLPPTLSKLFVIWPEWHLHVEIRPQLKEIVRARGFDVLDLYDHFGNTPETLGWDTVHPSAKTAAKGAEKIYEVLQPL